MKRILSILALTLALGPALQAAPKRQAKTAPVVLELNNPQEQVIVDQLMAVIEPLNPGIGAKATTLEAKKGLIAGLPSETREKAFEAIVHRMMDNHLEHPFQAPVDTDYSQLDMFFVLAKNLMSHDAELGKSFESCLGEKQIFSLGKKLNGCLERTPESIQRLLSIKRMGMMEKVRLMNLIKTRMGTKAPTTQAYELKNSQEASSTQTKSKMPQVNLELVVSNVISAFAGSLIALYSFLFLRKNNLEKIN